jgi:hypothetical protein
VMVATLWRARGYHGAATFPAAEPAPLAKAG